MSDSPSTSTQKSRKTIALTALIVVFAIAILINILFGAFGWRFDLTEYKTYTLSEGTKNILQQLETPVTVRYYVTDDNKVMGPSERARARRVEDLLRELSHAASKRELELVNENGEFETQTVRMLKVEKLNPEPNTDAEDSAVLDGLQPGLSGETNYEVFFGIAIECLDSKETIPFIPARPETTLEYDLVRAISNVHGGKDKKIGVMTSLSISGGFSGNFQAPPQTAWMFYEQLSRDYEVEFFPISAKEIPSDVTTLIVLHPHDISVEGQYSIDQYLLGGGNVLAFVDPNFFYARALAQGQPQMPGMPPQGGPNPTSNLSELFRAWGVGFDSTRVLADLDFGSEIIRRGNFSPTFLTLDRSALGSGDDPGLTDPMTRMLNHLNMLTPGAFVVDAPEGIKVDNLILSSPNNQLVGSFDADPTQDGGADRIREKFEAFGEPRALVTRLSGTFSSAFPEGDPATPGEEENEEESEEESEKESDEPKKASLTESVAPGRVVLIADADFIYDANVVRRNQVPGLGVVIPELLNENLTLVQNAVEQLSGDPDLINVRSRSSVRRPFTRQSEWYREAEQKYSDALANFAAQREEVASRLGAILAQTPDNIDEALLSPEVQAEMKTLQEQEAEFRKKERDLQKEVTREFRRKLATYKFGNTLLMPVLIVIFGIGLAIYRRSKVAAR